MPYFRSSNLSQNQTEMPKINARGLCLMARIWHYINNLHRNLFDRCSTYMDKKMSWIFKYWFIFCMHFKSFSRSWQESSVIHLSINIVELLIHRLPGGIDCRFKENFLYWSCKPPSTGPLVTCSTDVGGKKSSIPQCQEHLCVF